MSPRFPTRGGFFVWLTVFSLAIVFLARNAWHLDRAQQDFPKLKFLKIKEQPH